MKDNSQRSWLVKSSGKILGPFTFQEVLNLLKSRRVTIIDEIREPQVRWKFVREHKQFEQIVHQLRAEEALFLDQETEAGVAPHSIKGFDPTLPENQKSLPHDRPQEAVLRKPRPQLPSYGLPSANERKSVLLATKSGLLWVVSLVSIAGAGFYYIQNRSGGGGKTLSTENLVKIARVNKNIGAIETALEFYHKAAAIESLDLNSKLQMATLLLEVSNQTVEARRIIEEILPKISAKEDIRKEAQLILALSFLKESNFSKAEQVYQSILFSDGGQIEARTNLGLLHLLRSEFLAANKELNTLQKEGAEEPLIYIGKAITSLGLNEGKTNIDRLKSSFSDLDKLNARSSEFRLEALLIQAVLAQKMGQPRQAEKSIALMLEEDPRLTRDHAHNLFVDRQMIKWDRLAMYCDYLVTKLPESPVSKGLGSFCLFQKEEVGLALQRVEDAHNQYVQSPILIGLRAAYLLSSNRIPEAKNFAKTALDSSPLASRIYALACEEQNDLACAEQNWSRILVKNSRDLGALHGLAHIQFIKNSRDKSLEYIKRGLTESSNYVPLLELKEKMDAP